MKPEGSVIYTKRHDSCLVGVFSQQIKANQFGVVRTGAHTNMTVVPEKSLR